MLYNCPGAPPHPLAPEQSDAEREEDRMSSDVLSKSACIAKLNDEFRKTGKGGKTIMTRAVAGLSVETIARAVAIVQTFNDFNEDNDPHGEHDFFHFEVAGESFFWKCDYYDKELKLGSDDPSDPKKTMRVATLMLASDY